MERNKGFSLLELIVVIAIVGILGAIAFPMYQSHIQRAACDSGKAGLKEAELIMNQLYMTYGSYQNEASIDGGATSGSFKAKPTIDSDGGGTSDFTVTVSNLTATTYTLTATTTANGRLKSKSGSLSINQEGNKTGTLNGVDVWTNGCSSL